jgi:hypothetical protein
MRRISSAVLLVAVATSGLALAAPNATGTPPASWKLFATAPPELKIVGLAIASNGDLILIADQGSAGQTGAAAVWAGGLHDRNALPFARELHASLPAAPMSLIVAPRSR